MTVGAKPQIRLRVCGREKRELAIRGGRASGRAGRSGEAGEEAREGIGVNREQLACDNIMRFKNLISHKEAYVNHYS